MDEQFDKKLTNHIRKVFDNYEHPPAEEGWMQLRKKFPPEQKKSNTFLLWWASAAAILLVLAGLGLWYTQQDTPLNNYVNKPHTKQQLLKDSTKNIITEVTKEQTGSTKSNPTSTAETVAPQTRFNETKPYNPYTPGVTDNYLASATNAPGKVAIPDTKDNSKPETGAINAGSMAAVQKPVINNNVPVADSAKNAANSVANQPQITNNTQPAITPKQNSIIVQKQPANTMAAMLNEDKMRQDKKTESNRNDKKVNFSVYAATYFNYAQGSSNQINAGAGFTSDIRLSKNLKFSTGVALAQNSLSYNSTPPQAANAALANVATFKTEGLFSPAVAIPVFQNYNVNLVGLDIPINIKYEFNPQKTDAFISAGLSSGTFIDENYTYRYTYASGTEKSFTTQPQDQTTRKSFNNFYFGRTLNLSFGVGYPVGSNRLVIEPFLKYPLGGLGAQDIRFGAGGINLKFSFKSQKK